MEPKTENQTQYAVMVTSGFAEGQYVNRISDGGHFSYQAKTLDDALLFATAASAEYSTRAADHLRSLSRAVVPVKVREVVTTTTVRERI